MFFIRQTYIEIKFKFDLKLVALSPDLKFKTMHVNWFLKTSDTK